MSQSDEGDEGDFRHEPGRLLALIDGIFAISMTLLVIDVRIPDGTPDSVAGYAAADGDLFFRIGIFLASFVIASRFWVVNHRQMRHVHHIDAGLIERTIFFLAGICTLPVATSVLFRFGSIPDAVTFAALVLSATTLLSARLWWYLSSPRRDLADVEPAERRRQLFHSFGNIVVYLSAIPLVHLLPDGSKGYSLLIWLLLRVVDPVTDRLHGLISRRHRVPAEKTRA